MRKVKSKNTTPEVQLRKLLWGMGYRGYRIHYSELPGCPDVAPLLFVCAKYISPVIKLADPAVIRSCSETVRRRVYEILKEEFGGK